MTNPPPADQTCFGHLVLEFDILQCSTSQGVTRSRPFPEQQKYLKAVINVFHFDILRFFGSYSLLDKGFHLNLVAIGANGDGPVMVGTVGSCSQGAVAIKDLPGGQMEWVVKADGEHRDSGL